jgi:hypothetical protein
MVALDLCRFAVVFWPRLEGGQNLTEEYDARRCSRCLINSQVDSPISSRAEYLHQEVAKLRQAMFMAFKAGISDWRGNGCGWGHVRRNGTDHAKVYGPLSAGNFGRQLCVYAKGGRACRLLQRIPRARWRVTQTSLLLVLYHGGRIQS